MTAREALFQNIPPVIETMGKAEFDSHEFMIKLARDYQSLYVQALNEMESDTPFQQLHAQIGKQLSRLASLEEIKKNPQHRSKDIFQNESECALWRRL